jgi:hypothetical protein
MNAAANLVAGAAPLPRRQTEIGDGDGDGDVADPDLGRAVREVGAAVLDFGRAVRGADLDLPTPFPAISRAASTRR